MAIEDVCEACGLSAILTWQMSVWHCLRILEGWCSNCCGRNVDVQMHNNILLGSVGDASKQSSISSFFGKGCKDKAINLDSDEDQDDEDQQPSSSLVCVRTHVCLRGRASLMLTCSCHKTFVHTCRLSACTCSLTRVPKCIRFL